MRKNQDPEAYNKKLQELKQLVELEKANYLDIFYADATGFNQTGYVPYGWQPLGEYIEITPEKGKNLQLFGLMSKDNRFEGYASNQALNSAMVIAFIDDFATKITQKTVIVLDNAPIHHSLEFESRIEEWKEQDLYIFYLPTYSPHLNPIEILWRKVKYEWLLYEQIDTFEELEEEVISILNNFGKDKTYSIQFNAELLAKEKVANIFA